jgi:hypothetical protein
MMKNEKIAGQTAQLTVDSQNRLLAYTTAVGLGAFFAQQNAGAQVVESSAFATYPQTLVPGSGTGYYHTYFYLNVDGSTNGPEFNLDVNSWRVDISGTPLANHVLNPSTNAYVIPWTNGAAINATNSSTPTYQRFLANSYFGSPGTYLFNDFTTNSGAQGPFDLGFSFIGSDGLTHFGYMDIQVNGALGVYGNFTATVNGIYYNQTPNAAITIGASSPVSVTITSINVGAGNVVTINFTSSDSAAASAFALQTSPVLGVSASWTTDAGAVITSLSAGVYQAVTTGTGGASQFYRISH